MLLARRFTLNPVLVVISLVFWFWMWGIPGAIISVPMLAITKIICDRVRPLAAFGYFLEEWINEKTRRKRRASPNQGASKAP
jgi:predicted PurR-regulated permease PerM